MTWFDEDDELSTPTIPDDPLPWTEQKLSEPRFWTWTEIGIYCNSDWYTVIILLCFSGQPNNTKKYSLMLLDYKVKNVRQMLYLKNKHVIARCRQFFVLEYLPNQWAVQTLGHRRLAETTPPVNFRHRKRQNPAKTGLRNVRDFRRCFSPAFRSAEATWTSTARFLQRNLGPIDIKTFWPELPVPYLSCSKGPWWVSTLINLHLIKQHYPVCVHKLINCNKFSHRKWCVFMSGTLNCGKRVFEELVPACLPTSGLFPSTRLAPPSCCLLAWWPA